jgi:hypothetical protein
LYRIFKLVTTHGSTLPLLVAGFLANHPDDPPAFDDLAVPADSFD